LSQGSGVSSHAKGGVRNKLNTLAFFSFFFLAQMKTSSTVKNSYWLHCFLREFFLKQKKPKKQGVCHTVALPFYIKKYLKAKEEEFMETQIFHHSKNIIFQKSSERNQNPSRYYYNVYDN